MSFGYDSLLKNYQLGPPRATSTLNSVKLCTSHDKCMLFQLQEVRNFFGFYSLSDLLVTINMIHPSDVTGKHFYAKNIVSNFLLELPIIDLSRVA